ncbi:MAG TPA: hypothetical protein VGB98_24760 [Pyrinomonadaceae bacterium]|jgi:hypothetical protein
MNNLYELDQELATDYNVNVWSDDVVLYAGQLADGLSDEEWAELERVWRDRPAAWQAKLAEAVFSSPKPRVVGLLVEMLKSPETEGALSAAEHLAAKDDVWTPDESVRGDLERLLARLEGKNRETVESLLARIPG